MINVKDCTDKCTALVFGECTALNERECDPSKYDYSCCDFYKPAGCEDWVRVEEDGEAWFYTPEEYAVRWRRMEHEQGLQK